MKKLLLWLLVIFPGAAGTLFFAAWSWIDFMLLRRNFAQFEKTAKGHDLQAVIVAEARQNIHRINVFADGTWALLCLILLGMGVCTIYLGRRD